MLQLKNIVKTYKAGDSTVEALKGINLAFRDSEFVSILGPSGCGKTTLLNIIGGLDVYTSGNLRINGISTKKYRDSDWDTYRNHSVGFVFQTYNLIPHQTVLSNVELALTLSGVSKTERRKRAKEALEKVGLGDQLHKKPNQMSGGQMQRVAIARAIVNDPEILLADEPTGALDTATSVQVMEILKEISRDRLIIMVTHNPQLAEEYSSRIVRLLDGQVVSDTDPYPETEAEANRQRLRELYESGQTAHKGRKSMSFFTALSLSFNNLMTKRARTLLTSFAGSIGIIGIALILAVSTGIQSYVDTVQRDTLSSYPLTVSKESDMLSNMLSAMGNRKDDTSEEPGSSHELDAVYSNPQMFNMFNALFAQDDKSNDLTAFKAYLDREADPDTAKTELMQYVSAIQYQYDVPMNVYVKNADGVYVNCDISTALSGFGSDQSQTNSTIYGMLTSNLSNFEFWEELLPGQNGDGISDSVTTNYDLLYGQWPEKENEVVLMLDRNNEITDFGFYVLGLTSGDEVKQIVSSALTGSSVPVVERTISYEDVCNTEFRLLLNSDYYTDKDGDGVYTYIGDDETTVNMLLDNAYTLKISGVVRSNSDTASSATILGYTSALTNLLIKKTLENPAVIAQSAAENSNYDVVSGLPFVITDAIDPTDEYKAKVISEYFASLTNAEKRALYTKMISVPTQAYIKEKADEYMSYLTSRDDMIALVVNNYGMDEQTVREYLSSYTDEELTALIREQVEKTIVTQYAAQAEEKVKELISTPTEEELQSLIDMIKGQLTSRVAKVGYIVNAWAEDVTIDSTTMTLYLLDVSDEELEAALDKVARSAATGYYAQMVSAGAVDSDAKVAAVFDNTYGAETDTSTLAGYYDAYMPSTTSSSTLSDCLAALGYVDPAEPSVINIYASSFEDKDKISAAIDDFNTSVTEDERITYTDYVALLMSGITNIINAISYALIIFVSISLVVSSIMIGIITYISVLERTKEIGILRAVGASKHDVSLVFNAETFIVGLIAGLMGVGLSALLCLPINLIVHHLTGIMDINAFLQPLHCVILVLISMVLTIVAGLFPSAVAAKKDPVEALRTE